MRVLDRLNEIMIFDTIPVTTEKAVSYTYNHRIYISELLDEDLPKDVHKLVENFLDGMVYFDGDESHLWKHFLDLDYETLLRMEEFL